MFWVPSPTGGNVTFLKHLDANFVQKWQKCQIYVIYENLFFIEEHCTVLVSFTNTQLQQILCRGAHNLYSDGMQLHLPDQIKPCIQSDAAIA